MYIEKVCEYSFKYTLLIKNHIENIVLKLFRYFSICVIIHYQY